MLSKDRASKIRELMAGNELVDSAILKSLYFLEDDNGLPIALAHGEVMDSLESIAKEFNVGIFNLGNGVFVMMEDRGDGFSEITIVGDYIAVYDFVDFFAITVHDPAT